MKKKHPCKDCHECQWCSDRRCSLCLCQKSGQKKLSLKEQIALYEEINHRAYHKKKKGATPFSEEEKPGKTP